LNDTPESLKGHASLDVASGKIDGRVALIMDTVQQGEKLIQLFTSQAETLPFSIVTVYVSFVCSLLLPYLIL
jgi:hypothetical protein